MSDVLDRLLADLAAESAALRAAVADLTEDQWRTPTPAEGWDVATSIAHLLWTDETSVVAIDATIGDAKPAWDAIVTEAIADMEGYVDAESLRIAASSSGTELLARWDASRVALAERLRAVPDGAKLMWFGPPMSPASMVTARFMETWAHGQDVYEALGRSAPRTDRVANVANLGFRTRNFAFAANGLPAPTAEIQVTLVLPSEDVVTFGPDEAPQTITGSAWDFARLVTQRVHRADTDLVANGPDAEQWLDIAQAFAGPPGKGRDRA